MKAFCLGIALLWIAAIPASAVSTFTVTNTHDSGTGSLRTAITSANSSASGGAIVFQSGVTGVITLSSALPTITTSQPVTITGPGAASLAIDGAATFRVFELESGADVTISGLTIRNGKTGFDYGGGILNQGSLALTSCVLSGNVSGYWGGGIFNFGVLTLTSCTITGNSAMSGGAGIANVNGTLSITGCTVSNNILTSNIGGGLAIEGGHTTIGKSTFSGNTAGDGSGGAIGMLADATLTIDQSTFVNNTASLGGAIFLAGTVTLKRSTVSKNTASNNQVGGIRGSVAMSNTIVAGNTGGDFSGTITSGGYNLIGIGPFGLVNGVNHNLVGTANSPLGAKLRDLADNGGPTQTMLPSPSSPLIGAGDATSAPAADQRGFTRVVNGSMDIGAVEFQGTVSGNPSGSGQIANLNTAFGLPLTSTWTEATTNVVLANESVAYIAPSSGASASIAAAVTTDSNGRSSPTATANGIPGGYNVTATLGGVSATYGLTNLGPVSHFSVTAPASATAGTNFSVTITALDAAGTVIAGYRGTVHFTKSDNGAASVVPANYTFVAGDNGVHTFTNGFKLVTAPSQTVTATDTVTSSITGSGTVAVSPAANTLLSLTAPSTAALANAFTVTVTAIDAFGNTTPGYRGTVHFTKSDSGTGSAVPANYTFTAVDMGAHTFTNGATLTTLGSQTVTATDTVTSSIKSTTTLTVATVTATHFTVEAEGGTWVLGERVFVFVTAKDDANHTATTYAGKVHFTSSDAAAVIINDVTLTNGIFSVPAVDLNTVGTWTITATDTVNASITGTTGNIPIAAPASFVVTNLNDSGTGSLRAAIANSNASSTGGVITFQAGLTGTILLTTGTLTINRSTKIIGPGASLLAIDGGNAFRIFLANLGLSISGLTIQHGVDSGTNLSSDGNGGGAVSYVSTLTLISSVITANQQTGIGRGGALFSGWTYSILIMDRCTVSGNIASGTIAQGGGLYSPGLVTITKSTFSGNQATGAVGNQSQGGAMILNGGGITTATISDSTIAGNSSIDPNNNFSVAGGIASLTTLVVKNSTVSGNTATAGVGGIWNPFATLRVTLSNTIVAGNTSLAGTVSTAGFADGDGAFIDGGHNLIGKSNNAAGIANGVNGNLVGTSVSPINPQLGALANNGGPTQTMLPAPTSPAHNAGSTDGATATDQRGFPRIVNGGIDIGAVEFQGMALTATGGTPQSTIVNSNFAAPLQASITEAVSNVPLPLANQSVSFTTLSDNGGDVAGLFGRAPVLTDANGVASLVATANTRVGSYTVTASYSNLTAAFSLTNLPSAAGAVTATGGTPQSTPVATAYPAALQATVKDFFGNAVPGATVTFAAPASGASVTFTSGNTAVSNTNGVASVAVTANNVAGPYTVSATIPVQNANVAYYVLNNSCATPVPSLVTNLNDDGPGSLRRAITCVAPGSTITFDVTGKISLASPLLVGQNLSISGPGAASLALDGGNAVRVLRVFAGSTVSVSGVTIQNGLDTTPETEPGGGGGIWNQGTLALSSCAVNGNRQTGSGVGAGIMNSKGATLTIDRCTVSNNTASGSFPHGGGLYSYGPATITNSTFSGNTVLGGAAAPATGGAIYSEWEMPLTIVGSTLTGNSVTNPGYPDSSSLGGGIYSLGTTTLKNSTVVGNSALGPLNTAVGGIYQFGTTGSRSDPLQKLILTNTIVAGNTAGSSNDINSRPTSGTNNLIGDNDGLSGITNGTNGNIVGTTASPIDPRLAALADNGGPTKTMLPALTSPVRGAGTTTNALSTDQRGFPRTVNGAIDMGAVEFQGVTLTATGGTPQNATAGLGFAAPLQAGLTETTSNAPLVNQTVAFAAPSTGPSATIAPSVATDSNGIASLPATANMTAGSYDVTASFAGANNVTFALTNVAGAAAAISATAGTPQSAAIGTAFTTSLQATVRDSYGNPMSGATVTFTAPLSGESAIFPSGNTATTNASGQASVAVTANNIVGSYEVVAAVNSVNASFSLTNSCTSTSPLVTNLNNDGPGSLRQAMACVAPNSTITFGVTGTITLASALNIAQNLTISGPGAESLILDGNATTRVLSVAGGVTASISGMTIQHGKLMDGTAGAGIFGSQASVLFIDRSAISGNSSNGPGGGIYSDGPLFITNSTVSGNSGAPSAIWADVHSSLNIRSSTFSGNTGGMKTSLILTMKNSTIAGNTGTGPALDIQGTCVLTNTILAGNAASDGAGSCTDSGNNLIGNSQGLTGFTNGVNGTQTGTSASPLDAKLGALADNGGPTRTMLPRADSPALGTGNPAVPPATDQRGFARVTNSKIDIGAVQFQGASLAVSAGTPQSTAIGTAFGTALAVTAVESCTGCISPVAGLAVTFAAPGIGPSATFGGSATVSTGANGLATSPVLTANAIGGGPYTLTASATTPDQASPASANFTLTNLAASQTIIGFGVIAAQTYGTAPFVINGVSATSGLGVTFTSTTLSVCTVAGSTVTILSAGPCSITASQDGNLSYTAALSITQGFTVTPAALTVTANARSKTYGQSVTFAGTEFTHGTLFNGDTLTSLTLSSSGATATAGVAASPYSIVPSAAAGTGLGNYTINYVAGSLTVNTAPLTITATSTSKPYGSTFTGTAFTTSGLLNSDSVSSVTLTSAGAAASAAIGGSPYPLVPSAAAGSGLGNYAITYANGTLMVTPATLTITASARSKTYGQSVTFAGSEFTTGGLQGGDSVSSVTLTSSGSAATASVAASPYPIVASAASGSGLGNYNVVYVDGSLTVSAAPLTVTATSAGKTYGTTFSGAAFTTSGLLNADSVTSVTLTSPGAASTATVAASPYTLTPSAAVGSGLGNYTIAYVNGSLTVNRAPLTITATSASKPYGSVFAGTAFTTAGLLNGDTVTSVTLTSTGAAAAASITASPYALIPSAAAGSGLGNYMISYVNGTLTVTPATLTITASPRTKVYGQSVTFAGTEFTATGLQGTDAVTSVTLTSAGSAATATVAASPYTIVPSAATGVGLANYSISYVSGALTVTTAPLTITASNAPKTYGAVFTGTAFTTSGLLNGDTVTSVTLTSTGAASTATVAASPYAIVPSAAVGSGLGNYAISYAYGSLTVNRAPLTITATSASKSYGTSFSGTAFTTAGLLNGDTVSSVTLTSAGTEASANTAASPYVLVPSAAQGNGLSNYSINYVNGSLTVTPAPLTITASPRSKIYGQSVSFAGTEFTATGLQGSDAVTSVTLTSAGSTATATVAGSPYSITSSAATGPGLGNYTIGYVPGSLTVTAAPLTVTAANASKTYGAVFNGTAFTTSGLVNGDTVTGVTLSSPGAAATAAVAASPYAIVPSAAAGTGLANYAIAYSNGSLTVNPAPLTITATSASKTYGGSFSGTAFTSSTLFNGDTVSSVTLTSPGAPATAAVAGSPYAIVPSAAIGTGLANYTISYASGALAVNRATLAVTANNASRLYGAIDPAFSAAITGFVNGEAKDVVSGTPVLATTATASSVPGVYPITAAAGSLVAANYSFTFTDGALTIAAGTLTVTAAGNTRAYGAANSLTYSIAGFVNGDTIAVVSGAPVLSTDAEVASPPGAYAVTASLGTLTAANYIFAFAPGTLNVTKILSDFGVSRVAPGLTVSVGQSFTLTFFAVGVNGAAAPTGAAIYTIDGGTPQSAALSNSTATATIAGLPIGSHAALIHYSGDGNYLSTTPMQLTLIITKNTSQVSVAASQSLVSEGQSFVLSFTVTGSAGPAAPAPSGLVSCGIDSPAISRAATITGGSGTLTLAGLAIGTHTVNCTYSGDTIYPAVAANTLLLTVQSGIPAINAGGIVGAASAAAGMSPGGLLSIYGDSLATAIVSATSLPLPLTLGDTQVLVNGAPCPLLYVSPTQINCAAPYATPVNQPVQVAVVMNGTSSTPVTATFIPYAPQVFTYPRTETAIDPVIVHIDNSLVTPDHPAQPGEIVTIYATGAGKLNNPPLDGAAAPATPTATTVDTPAVTVGGAQAVVQFSGLTPGLVGLLQINVQLPPVLPPGPSLPLIISFPGAESPAVGLWVKLPQP